MDIFNAALSTVSPNPDQLDAISKANRWIPEAIPVAHKGFGETIRLTYIIEDEPALRLSLGPFGEFVDLHMWDNEEMPYSEENYDSDWASIDEGQLGEDIKDAILYN